MYNSQRYADDPSFVALNQNTEGFAVPLSRFG